MKVSLSEVRRIEELSINALSALQTVLYDGWILPSAGGCTGRANSVYPLYPSTLPLEEKLATCEAWYFSQGLLPRFKLTCGSLPTGLDNELAQRGYERSPDTCVYVLALDAQVQGRGLGSLRTLAAPDPRWFASLFRISPVSEAERPILQRMLGSIRGPSCFALLAHGGQTVAVGMAVLEGSYVGLFRIATHPAYRRRGYGRELVSQLLCWGRNHGAGKAYLQVFSTNTPAIRLYQSFGFQEAYRYWYRGKGKGCC